MYLHVYNRKGNYADQMFERMTTKDGSTYEIMVLGLVKVKKMFIVHTDIDYTNTLYLIYYYYKFHCSMAVRVQDPGQEHCVVFLGKTLYSHSSALHPGV